jgi:lipopolysaccharide export system permease protein
MTDVGFDRLYNRDKHYEYLSTWELMRRIRNPSFSHRSIRSQSLYLHTRLTQPILNLIVVGVGVPFVVRKESVSLLTNLAICCGVMGAMFAIDEAFQYLGKVSLLSPEMAVWAPIILWGTSAAWFTGLVRT